MPPREVNSASHKKEKTFFQQKHAFLSKTLEKSGENGKAKKAKKIIQNPKTHTEK